MSAQKDKIRIGGASGYWGDSQEAPKQLLTRGDIDYLVFDYLAEVTMSLLVRAKQKNDKAGYARDFVEQVMRPLLPEIKKRGVRVIANAGGVNIEACAQALREVADELDIALKIGTVEGDNLMPRLSELKELNIQEMFTGVDLPSSLISANAYLGAFPIAQALGEGAEVVITGRCVDSAVTLAPLIHEFGWGPSDYDRLASGTIAGHIIECGTQATGGNFTDWRDTVDDWDDMGYPIAECYPDGRFKITKPQGTGGLVSRLTISEQTLYEIGDPGAYIVPDVVCDVRDMKITETGPDEVEISNIRGRAPTDSFKVSATYSDGFRATYIMVITGFDAVEKAEASANAILKRTRRIMTERGFGDYHSTAIHIIGADTLWGAQAHGQGQGQAQPAREVVMQLDVRHGDRKALDVFAKETTGSVLAMTTGRCTAGVAGRPKVTPVMALYSFLLAKAFIEPKIFVDGEGVVTTPIEMSFSNTSEPPQLINSIEDVALPNDAVEVELVALAVARSGDKGNDANIGVIARAPEYLPWIKLALTEDKVRGGFSHFVEGDVSRYEAPGLLGLNFYLKKSLGGGGTSSMHLDSQAKTYAQQILTMRVKIPVELASKIKAAEAGR